MAEPQSDRELINQIRELLSNKGDLGTILLERIDSAIGEGIEEAESLGERKKKDIIGRRQPSDAEVIRIIHHVLKAYLVDLPSVAASFDSLLRKQFSVSEVKIIPRSDLVPEEQDSTIPKTVALSDYYYHTKEADLARLFTVLESQLSELDQTES